jgi:RNA polymerase sigma-70 factor (ECF subfamily)
LQGTDTAEIVDLVDRSLARERQAQQQLYQRYSRAMFNVCLRLMGSHADAEDMLQEAFVDAFQNLHRYHREVAFGAWLKRLTINRCLKTLEKRRVLTDSLEDYSIEHLAGSEPAQLSLDMDDESRFSMDMIRKAIAALPDGYRVVFSLYAVEGYDHEEIAQIMNISESTSKSQYHRAKTKVRSLLEAMAA